MRFTLENFLRGNPVRLMRQAGYTLISDYQEDSELSFIRRVGLDDYPRFHIYLRIYPKSKQIIFNLHIDQKKSVFKNYPDHGAEYEGKVIEQEAERIMGVLE